MSLKSVAAAAAVWLACAVSARADHLTTESRLVVSPDGSTALVTTDPKSLRLLSLAGKPPVAVALDQPAQRVDFSPDGQRLAVALEGGRVLLVGNADGAVTSVEPAGDSWCAALAWSPDGKRLVYALEKLENAKGEAPGSPAKLVTIKSYDVASGKAQTLDVSRAELRNGRTVLPVHAPEDNK